MKKYFLVIVALVFKLPMAYADMRLLSTQQFHMDAYGVLDVGYGSDQHSLPVNSQYASSVNPFAAVKTTVSTTATTTSVRTLFNGPLSDPRVGLKGGLDLSHGVKGFFTLEEGINLPTLQANNAAAALASNGGVATTASSNSSVDNQVFNRQAFVGLSYEQYGSISYGRNYTPIYDIGINYDPVQDAQLFSPISAGSYGGGGGVSEDTRSANSLKYKNKLGLFNFGVLYKFGGNPSAGTAVTSGFALHGGYETSHFGIQAAYQVFHDAVKGSAGLMAHTVSLTVEDTKTFFLAVKYKLGSASLKAGYESYRIGAPSFTLNGVSSYYGENVSAITHFSSAAQTTQIAFLGGCYGFTEKLSVAAGFYAVHLLPSLDYTATSPSNATAKTGQASAYQSYLSLLADYQVTKALDTYAGVMHSRFAGAAYSMGTGYYASNNIAAIGARYIF